MAPTPPIRSPELERALDARADADQLRSTWDALPDAVPAAVPDAVSVARRAQAWSRLEARLDDPARAPFTEDVPAPLALVEPPAVEVERTALTEATVVPIAGRSRRGWWSPRAVAAAAALLVGARGWWGTSSATISASPTQPSTVVELADGSRIDLARGATLRVPRALGWPAGLRSRSRELQLTGAAFFTVSHDGRPFVVRTADASVRVLGTRFEVRSPTPASGTRVLVESGRVQVAAVGRRAAVTLTAGERTAVSAAALTVTRTAPDRIAAWRTGGLAALDEPLGVVLAELARRYDTAITVRDPAAAAAVVSLFYAEAPSLETVLADLCTAQGLRFTRVSEGFVVQRGP